MAVFENLEISSFGKNFFKDLNPGKAPQYFLIIAIDIALVHICSGMLTDYWLQLFIVFTILLGFILFSATRNKHFLEVQHIVGQLKTARIISVAVAILALASASVETQNFGPAFYAVLLAASVQIFFALRFDTKYKWVSDKKIKIVNLPQLTLISSSLLIGFIISTSDFATRAQVTTMEQELYGNKYMNYPSDSAYEKQKDEFPFARQKELIKKDSELYTKQVRLRPWLTEKKNNTETFADSTSSEGNDTTQSKEIIEPTMTPENQKADSLIVLERGKIQKELSANEKDIEKIRTTKMAIGKSIPLLNSLMLSMENRQEIQSEVPGYIWMIVRREKVHFGFTSIVLFSAWLISFLSIVLFSRRINKDILVDEKTSEAQQEA